MEDGNLNYTEEIRYREEILQKVRNKVKVSPDERKWLATHSIYNRILGFPFLNMAIETLRPNQWYSLKIKVESVTYDGRILPVLHVPAGKGQISVDCELRDLKGRTSQGKSIQMLGVEWGIIGQEYLMDYKSSLGLISVEYECEYFDIKQKIQIRRTSSTDHSFAMMRTVVNDHTVRYHCKSPQKDSFDAMVFTVEWIDGKNINNEPCETTESF